MTGNYHRNNKGQWSHCAATRRPCPLQGAHINEYARRGLETLDTPHVSAIELKDKLDKIKAEYNNLKPVAVEYTKKSYEDKATLRELKENYATLNNRLNTFLDNPSTLNHDEFVKTKKDLQARIKESTQKIEEEKLNLKAKGYGTFEINSDHYDSWGPNVRLGNLAYEMELANIEHYETKSREDKFNSRIVATLPNSLGKYFTPSNGLNKIIPPELRGIGTIEDYNNAVEKLSSTRALDKDYEDASVQALRVEMQNVALKNYKTAQRELRKNFFNSSEMRKAHKAEGLKLKAFFDELNNLPNTSTIKIN